MHVLLDPIAQYWVEIDHVNYASLERIAQDYNKAHLQLAFCVVKGPTILLLAQPSLVHVIHVQLEPSILELDILCV
jgi:hypothetical protein